MRLRKIIILFGFLIFFNPALLLSAIDDFSKVSKVVQTFKADNFLGAGSTSIPIVVPPGRKGIQPEINPVYSSSVGNGWLGVGWNLDFGHIERMTNKGIPKYDSTDKFYISFMGINSELKTSTDLPNEYYPKTTSFFIKLLFKGSYWETYDKEGKKYIFGQTNDARIDLPKGTFSWHLNKIVDTCGNYLTIKYLNDGYQIYPSVIEYNANEVTRELPTHRVEFILESRNDIISSFRSGYNITTAKRLKEIKTYVSNNLANRYLFEYTYSRQTGRSLLMKFTSFGSDGLTSLPPTTFTYQDSNPDNYKIVYIEPKTGNKLWYIRKSYGWYGNTTGALYPKRSASQDFKGGGYLYWDFPEPLQASGAYWSVDAKGGLTVNLPEKTAFHAWTYVYVETAKTISVPFTGTGNFFFWLNSEYSEPVNPAQINLKEGANLIEITGYNATDSCNFDLNYALSDNVTRMHSNQFVIPQLSGDFNGDGLMDLATYFASSGRIKVSLSNGNGFQAAEYWPIKPGDGFPKYLEPQPPFNLLLGNFNGDTLTDIQAINGINQLEVIIPHTDHCFYDEGGGGGFRAFSVKGIPFAADFNGDGLTDIGLQAENTNDILIALLWAQSPSLYTFRNSTYWLYNFGGKILIGDFNGDGLIDIASYDSGQSKISVALNKGDSFDAPKTWITGFKPPSEPSTTDYNADGVTDICYYDKLNGQLFVAASKGNQFLPPIKFLSGFTIKDPDVVLQTSDFNGDSAADFYIFNPYTQKTEITYSKASFIDLLTKVDNGVGGGIAIKYDGSGNYDNTITDELKKEYEYKYLSGSGLPFSVAVIKEIITSDGMGNSYSQLYSYKGGFYDRNDREFRGFGYVSITDAEGNQKEIYFKQGDILKGKPYLENYKDSQGKLYLKIEKNWSYQTMATHPGDYTKAAGSFVFLSSEKKLIYDGDDTYKTSNISYAYSGDVNDQFVTGDLTKINEQADSTRGRQRYILYTRATGDSILSRPFCTFVWNGRVLSKKWLYYDNNTDLQMPPIKGLLTKEKICIFSGDFSWDRDMDPIKAPIVLTYAYDSYGNLISKTDPENHTTTTTYDAAYHIYPVEVRNALGQTTKSTYDPKTGQVLTSTDANNQTTAYIYDKFGRLINVIGPNDTAQYPGTIYEYDLSSQPIKITKRYKTAYPSTYALEYSFYDGLGRLIETKIQAEDAGSQARQTVKDAVIFNQQGKVKEKYNPYFVVSSASYTPLSSAIPKTTFEYDCLGRITKVVNPDLTYRAIQYSDWTQTKTDENGHKICTTYDGLNRLIKQEEFNEGYTYTTQYDYELVEYDLEANLYRKVFKITDNKNNVTKIFYDIADRKVKMSDPDMGIWYYTYDNAGNLKTQKDAKGQTITFTYDAINRVSKKAYPDGKYITYYYDDAAKTYCIGRLSYVTDLSGRTDYYYDKLGRQTKTTKSVDGVAYAIERTYNAQDQVTSIKYPDGEVVNYTYNKANGVKKIEGLSLQGTVPYISNVDYAPSGQIAKINYGNNAYTDYIYDTNTFRLTDLRTNNGALQNLRYQYDNVGNIAHITDYRNSATQDFIYDDLNRIISAAGSYGAFSYAYDSIGNMVYKEGVSYGYGQSGVNPHAVTYGSDGFNAVYDANGNMIRKNNMALTYDYDNRLAKIEPSAATEPIIVELLLTEGWNFVSLPLTVSDNKVTSVLSSISGNYTQVSRYNPTSAKFEHFVNDSRYDQFTTMETGKGYQIYVKTPCVLRLSGKLPAANYNISLLSGWQMIGPVSKSKVKVNEALTNLVKGTNYDRICRYDKTSGVFVNLAATDYLNAGQAYFIRLLKNSTWTIPAAKPDPAVDKLTFVYDAEGNRVKKIINGVTTTIYVDELYEKTGSLITKHIYLGENRVASKTGTQVLYYHSDHLGSSNVITNSSGAQTQLSEYKPYGELSKNTAKFTNYYFTGKELDASGLYYYGARYYDPRVGRFIQPDPLQFDDPDSAAITGGTKYEFLRNPQNFNRYAYCLNNPLRYIDPTGYYSREKFNQDFNGWLYNLTQGINWGSYNIIQPITNTFYSPGYNYGQWIYGEKNLRSFYGASLDAAWAITGVSGAFSIAETAYYNLSGSTSWRYTGPASKTLEESGWITRGRMAPYGTDFKVAMNRLSSPIEWNAVEQVNIPYNQYIAGPRPAAPIWNEVTQTFTKGMGAEYRIGGFRNWGEYFRNWIDYIVYLMEK